jgi:pyrrolidone-carboxylate peptidase
MAASEAHASRILVSAFDPFAGRQENRSRVVLEELARALVSTDIEVIPCILPVVYDRATEALQDCLAASGPVDFVLGLGEGGCTLTLETAAQNRDATPGMADNAGEIRRDSPILRGGADSLGLFFPVERLYCGLPNEWRDRVALSRSPGAFVCNNTAYRMTHALGMDVPFTFIHVPPAHCTQPAGRPEAQALAEAITQPLFFEWIPQRLPSNRAEAIERAEQWQGQCEAEFFRKLATKY